MLPLPKRDKSGKATKNVGRSLVFKSLYGGAPGAKPKDASLDGQAPGLGVRSAAGGYSSSPQPPPPAAPVLHEKSFSHHREHEHGAVMAKAVSTSNMQPQPTSPPGKKLACGSVVKGGADELAFALTNINGRDYSAYQDIKGCWEMRNFKLFVDHVQADPYDAPSRCRVQVAQSVASFPTWLMSNRVRRTALCDYLARRLAEVLGAAGGERRGTSGDNPGGEITVDAPGQNVLERTSVTVNSSYVEARFSVGLPAEGRTVMGDWAIRILTKNLAVHVERAIFFNHQDAHALQRHVETVEDANILRSQLGQQGLVSFIANGSILPRRAGNSNKPMSAQEAVKFESPPSMEVTMSAPHTGKIKGMGIKKGVTLIVGGGFNGKSTLLNAIEMGVYNKVPGDGREFVVTDADAVKIRCEEGRRVASVDISPFLSLYGKDTTNYSTVEASGSTSQSANIQEAVEAGASVLLLDEDSCATNFMFRDERMQALVSKEKEPVTPFVVKVRTLSDHQLSTILVVGGNGQYFDVADRVISMESYCPKDVTSEAKRIVELFGESAVLRKWGVRAYPGVVQRCIAPAAYYREASTNVRDRFRIYFGSELLELGAVEQLVEVSQTRAVAEAVHYIQSGAAAQGPFSKRSLSNILDHLEQEFDRQVGKAPAAPHGVFMQLVVYVWGA
eukprot:evm.model.scf_559.1 EVM.evm.TU.scf_559.1   scf_559:3868-11982(+)